MSAILNYIKLIEDDAGTTNVVGDGDGAVKLYAPPLGKKLVTHGLVEGDDMDEPVEEQMIIPTSPDDPPKQIYQFLQAQKKANDPEDS